MNATPFLLATLLAAAAVLGVYAYAGLALVAQRRLAIRAPPESVASALALGVATPACGCTALPLARRAAQRPAAAFLAAAYAANPLLALAALVLAGPLAALAVLALALATASAFAVLAPARVASARRFRLEDLLLKRDGSPFADALAYARGYSPHALALGAAVGLSTAVAPWGPAVAVLALALAFGPPRREIAEDHGPAFARALAAAHATFAALAALATGALA